MHTKLDLLRRRALDLFFPERCAFCGRLIDFEKHLCEDCEGQYERNYKCTGLDGIKVYSACVYSGLNRSVVLGAKNDRDGAKLDFMAYEISRCLYAFRPKIKQELDIIIPVPMYRTSKLLRGYNQSEKISRELSRLLCVPTVNAVRKIRRTKQQKTLDAAGRAENLSGCFALSDKIDLSGKHVLVVDDVTTTGATLAEICRTLKSADCKEIICAAFAKTEHEINNGKEKYI